MKGACDMVWEFYDLKGMKPIYGNTGDIITVKVPPSGKTYNDAIVNDLCYKNHFYYYCWFSFNFVSTLLRMRSLWQMLKSYKFLDEKEKDKRRRKLVKKEKARKDRIAKKKELNKLLVEKRNELYRKQQEHMILLIAANKLGGSDDS